MTKKSLIIHGTEVTDGDVWFVRLYFPIKHYSRGGILSADPARIWTGLAEAHVFPEYFYRDDSESDPPKIEWYRFGAEREICYSEDLTKVQPLVKYTIPENFDVNSIPLPENFIL